MSANFSTREMRTRGGSASMLNIHLCCCGLRRSTKVDGGGEANNSTTPETHTDWANKVALQAQSGRSHQAYQEAAPKAHVNRICKPTRLPSTTLTGAAPAQCLPVQCPCLSAAL